MKTSVVSRSPLTAFTLIELLTVIAIIGILAAIMIPTVGAVRKKAKNVTAQSNLRQIFNAFKLYALDNKDEICPGNDPRETGRMQHFPCHLQRYINQPWVAGYQTQRNIFYCPHEPSQSNPDAYLEGSYTMNYYCSGEATPFLGIIQPRPKRFSDFENPQLMAFLFENILGKSGSSIGMHAAYNPANIMKHDDKTLILFLDGRTQLRSTIEPWDSGMWIMQPPPTTPPSP
ncbi:N-terminal cleavage protein [Opitutaceae bacterium TAV5]|nr:N-terminal cleavage protein [Opitutaceae bacterium TAV5]